MVVVVVEDETDQGGREAKDLVAGVVGSDGYGEDGEDGLRGVGQGRGPSSHIQVWVSALRPAQCPAARRRRHAMMV